MHHGKKCDGNEKRLMQSKTLPQNRKLPVLLSNTNPLPLALQERKRQSTNWVLEYQNSCGILSILTMYFCFILLFYQIKVFWYFTLYSYWVLIISLRSSPVLRIPHFLLQSTTVIWPCIPLGRYRLCKQEEWTAFILGSWDNSQLLKIL